MTEKYRKKPVEVEVMKYSKNNFIEALRFASGNAAFDGFFGLKLKTLQGDMKVSDGDYIIKGVQGEFYPCKPDIFHKTYEPVTDHQPLFAVGEYYSLSDSLIAKVLKTSEGVCAIRVYSQNEDKFWDDHMAYRSLWGETRKPATAEQIATFQRAEHFASKGRKLDEFKTDDVCIFRNEVVLIQELDNADDLWFYGNQFGEEYLPKEELRHLTLIQTAEELQEVGEDIV